MQPAFERMPMKLCWLLLIAQCFVACSSRSDAPEPASDHPLFDFETQLAEMLPPLQEAYLVPGVAVGVIHDGEVFLKRGFGFADVEKERPVDAATAFNIGSISKTVAAWGVMKLVESGKVDLDAPVSRYLTRWQLPASAFDHDSVTVRRLLSHTSGLSLHGYSGFRPNDLLPSIEESLSGATNGAGAVYVAHEPGSKWQYSGGGYTLAQLIVEEVTGEPFAAFMESEVFVPLGMTDSSYVWDEHVDRIAATPYDGAGNALFGPRFTAMAAAGLQTTLDDFTRFALANVRLALDDDGTSSVLRRETVERMHQAVAPADDYGLGFEVEQRGGVLFVGHSGSNVGWMARFKFAPEIGGAIFVMTNDSNGGAIRDAVACEWQARVSGEVCDRNRELPIHVDESLLRRVEGRYPVADGPGLEFRVVDGYLFAYFDGGFRYRALARSETEFFLPAAPISFEFELDEEGNAASMLFRGRDQVVKRTLRVGGPTEEH